jgi:hypothetical protein
MSLLLAVGLCAVGDTIEHLHLARHELCSKTCNGAHRVQVKVLKKDPKGKEVMDSDTFTFDKKFTHNLYKIKINQIQIKETVEENKRTNDQVMHPMPVPCVPSFLALLNMSGAEVCNGHAVRESSFQHMFSSLYQEGCFFTLQVGKAICAWCG